MPNFLHQFLFFFQVFHILDFFVPTMAFPRIPNYCPTTSSAIQVSLTSRDWVFSNNFQIVLRGGYLWVLQKHLLNLATLTVGFTQDRVMAWMSKHEQETTTPSHITHTMLFNIPERNTYTREERAHFDDVWCRVTCKEGHFFGVPRPDIKVSPTVVFTHDELPEAGLDIIQQAIDDAVQTDGWPDQEQNQRAAYLSGLLTEEDKDYPFGDTAWIFDKNADVDVGGGGGGDDDDLW